MIVFVHEQSRAKTRSCVGQRAANAQSPDIIKYDRIGRRFSYETVESTTNNILSRVRRLQARIRPRYFTKRCIRRRKIIFFTKYHRIGAIFSRKYRTRVE